MLTALAVFVLQRTGEFRDAVTWVLFALFLVLVWLPIALRSARTLRETRMAFHEGLNER